MANDPKDDADRLFSCFKCGVSPPQSAFRERKKHRKIVKGETSKEETTSTLQKCENRSFSKDKQIGAISSTAIKLKRGNMISPVVFYGSPQGIPAKKPTHLLRLLREIRLDLRKQNDLIPSKDVWVTFPRQEEAIRFSKQHAQTYVFSYQDHLTGQRRFLVSSYQEFWQRYKVMDPKLRHHYEVIQEGLPCHMYFDLEFEKKINLDKNEDEIVDIFIEVIFEALLEKYGIQGNEDWIVELDSSNDKKFSRHLIIRIPNIAFKDNSHVGAFVSEVSSRISNKREMDPKLNKLYIIKESGSGTGTGTEYLFMDQAVYSRNRCFRFVYSSKAGKNSLLVPTGRFRCKNMSEEEVFMDSMICKIDDECDKLLICKLDLDFKRTLCFDSEVQETRNSNDLKLNLCLNLNSNTSYAFGKSPFPALDAFIESIASIGSTSGKIRCWYWFSEYGLMVYSMSKSRYCERIGREHKSNHVMYIVDFQRAGYYQKCYDPDCKGYKSPLRPLPWDSVPDPSSVLNLNRDKDINFDIKLTGENNLKNYEKLDKVELSSNSGTWWKEAVSFADRIENLNDAPCPRNLEDEIGDDSEWWINVEKIVSQVEEQILINQVSVS